jgi:hypothetical protein
MDKYIIRMNKNPIVYMQTGMINTGQINTAARISKDSFINHFTMVIGNGWSWLKFDNNGKLIEVTEIE